MSSFKAATLEQLPEVAIAIAGELKNTPPPFIVWLQGEMGSGKTTLVTQIFYALGLSKKTPVTSPTFTYLFEYKIGEDYYAHIDLYRLNDGCDLAEIGCEMQRYRAIFIEWPEKLAAGSAVPDWKINIARITASTRDITLS